MAIAQYISFPWENISYALSIPMFANSNSFGKWVVPLLMQR